MGLRVVPQCLFHVGGETLRDSITVHTHAPGSCVLWRGDWPHEHGDRSIYVSREQIPDLVEALWRAVDYKPLNRIDGNPEDFKRLTAAQWASVRGVLFHIDRLLDSVEFGTVQNEALMRLKSEFPE